jgi:hypothetical protein
MSGAGAHCASMGRPMMRLVLLRFALLAGVAALLQPADASSHRLTIDQEYASRQTLILRNLKEYRSDSVSCQLINRRTHLRCRGTISYTGLRVTMIHHRISFHRIRIIFFAHGESYDTTVVRYRS